MLTGILTRRTRTLKIRESIKLTPPETEEKDLRKKIVNILSRTILAMQYLLAYRYA